MSKILNLKPKKFSCFILLLLILCQISVNAAPICDCEDLPTQAEVEMCIENGLCESYDVPVNGNIWILAAAGVVLVGVKRKFFRQS